jgi:two-component system response regulator AlgR
MTIRVLIADDEVPARSRLRQMVSDIADSEVVGEAANGREVVELCAELSPDIVLLDIRMPDMDGIEAARHLDVLENSPAIIFTTAFDHYAIDAFDAHAMGYLLKPVRQERLARAIEHAQRSGRPRVSVLARSLKQPSTRTNICARRASGLQLIPIDEILFFQADQKYVTVNHLHGEDLIDEPLKDLLEEFGDRFIRIHRNALIAQAFLDHMDKGADSQYNIWLKHCSNPLAVSRRHVTTVKACLKHIA